MITEQQHKTAVVSDTLREANFGVDQEDMPFIISILRNKMYSNKPQAVIREYACNAWDSHVAAGISEPIEVTLPSSYDLNLRIKDRGIGLSEEEVFKTYIKYGRSTKRASNDYIGALGLGSKAGFAYGDSFLVVSCFEGRKTTYNAFLDESNMGKVVKMAEEETTEPNGIEIVVPVRDEDRDTFRTEACRFFSFWDVQPNFQNVAQDYYSNFLEQRKAIMASGDWKFTGKGSSYAVMGNVPYPINVHSLHNLSSPAHQLASAGIIIKFPIGALSVASSREHLEYDKKTVEAIKLALDRVVNEVEQSVASRFASCTNIWDAKLLAKKFQSPDSEFYRLRYIGQNGMKFRGNAVDTHSFSLEGFTFDQIDKAEYFIAKGDVKISRKTRTIDCDVDVVLVENDTGSQKHIKYRVAQLLERDNIRKVIVLTFQDDATKQAFIKGKEFEGVPFILASSLQVVRPNSDGRTSNGNSVANPKNARKALKFEYVDEENPPANWQICNIDIRWGKGVYVVIDHYRWFQGGLNGRKLDVGELESMLDTLREAGLDIDEVYGFKKSLVESDKVGSGWIELSAYVKNELPEVLERENIPQRWADKEELSGEHQLDFTNFPVSQDSVMGKYILAVEALNNSVGSVKQLNCCVAAAQSFGVPVSHDGVAPTCKLEFRKVTTAYPLLRAISLYAWNSYSEEIVEYVNSIEAAKAAKNSQ